MNEPDTLREVVALLNTYPDVCVISTEIHAQWCSIELTCGRMAVLSRITAWVMEGANQRMSILCRHPQPTKSGVRFKASDTHFLVEVERVHRKGERHTPLQILGVFLVWDLESQKRLAAAQSAKLLKKWHGANR